MKTTRTQESRSKVRLTIEASPDDVQPAVDRAFRDLAEQVKVPGFRKGKVPRRILEARLDQEAIKEATLREAIPALLKQAFLAEELSPVAAPEVEVSSFEMGGTLAFDATVEVRPDITLPPLESLMVSRPKIDVSDEEIDEQVGRLRERFASLQTIARPARAGDFALIDVRTYVHDTTIDNATATDLLYEIGSGSFVPELDAELEGKRSGDILKFNAALPEHFQSEFAGKEVSLQILVKEIREKVLPALDDEFAKTVSEYDTLAELRDDLRGHIVKAKEAQADAEVRSQLIDQLVESSDVEAPDSLVQDEVQFRASRLGERLRQAGMDFQAYLQAAGDTEENVERQLREQAERNVQAELVLEAVAKQEGITVEGAEIEEEIGRHAEQLGTDAAELGKRLEQSGRVASLAGDILRRKALDLIVSRAEIRDEES